MRGCEFIENVYFVHVDDFDASVFWVGVLFCVLELIRIAVGCTIRVCFGGLLARLVSALVRVLD